MKLMNLVDAVVALVVHTDATAVRYLSPASLAGMVRPAADELRMLRRIRVPGRFALMELPEGLTVVAIAPRRTIGNVSYPAYVTPVVRVED